jgi:hypothetical protein
MSKLPVIFCAAALLLGGCLVQQPIETSFDDAMAAQARAQLAPGTGTVKGSAFLRKPNGNFVTAGGEWVYLIPATPYALERFKKLFGEKHYNRAFLGRSVAPADPRYAELMRKQKAHKDGSFKFEDVKAGRYIVSTTLVWLPEDEYFLRGGAMYDEVTVKEDDTVEAILSGK